MSHLESSLQGWLPRPRVNLADLPLELKTKIAQLCAEQDEAFKTWSDAYARANEHDAQKVEEIRKFHGFSLGALFCTSKEWSEIAAPFRFPTLKASRTMDDTYRYIVAFRRAQHFTDLHIDSSDPTVLDAFLPILGQLSGVQRLAFEQSLLQHIFRDKQNSRERLCDRASAGAPTFALEALRRHVSRATRLELDLQGLHSLRTTLSTATCLRSLRIDLTTVDEPSRVVKGVLAWASHSLQELELDCDESTKIVVPSDVIEKGPSLRSITLNVVDVRPWHLRFALLFTATLARLRIAGPLEPPHPAAYALTDFFTGRTFDALKHLEVVGEHKIASRLLDLFTPAVSLERFVQADQHPLRHLHLFNPFKDRQLWEYSESSSLYRPQVRRIELQPTEAYPDPVMINGHEPGALDSCHAYYADMAVDRVVEYINEVHQRAQGNRRCRKAEYHRLAMLLKLAELDRVAMEG
ncbi:hypothetical protein JCM10450v2_008200 [Rhodotorula kratochvilovae]